MDMEAIKYIIPLIFSLLLMITKKTLIMMLFP